MDRVDNVKRVRAGSVNVGRNGRLGGGRPGVVEGVRAALLARRRLRRLVHDDVVAGGRLAVGAADDSPAVRGRGEVLRVNDGLDALGRGLLDDRKREVLHKIISASPRRSRAKDAYREARREVDEPGNLASVRVDESLNKMAVVVDVGLDDVRKGNRAVLLGEVLELELAVGRGRAKLGLDGRDGSLLADGRGRARHLARRRDEARAERNDLAVRVQRRVRDSVRDRDAVLRTQLSIGPPSTSNPTTYKVLVHVVVRSHRVGIAAGVLDVLLAKLLVDEGERARLEVGGDAVGRDRGLDASREGLVDRLGVEGADLETVRERAHAVSAVLCAQGPRRGEGGGAEDGERQESGREGNHDVLGIGLVWLG